MLRVAKLLLLSAVLSSPTAAPATRADVLRVCADPNNMPFSNRAGAGFENKLAELVAHDLGKTLVYTWALQRENFVSRLDSILIRERTAIRSLLRTYGV
jgi:mxaJ protein